jgi:hypothetical protein
MDELIEKLRQEWLRQRLVVGNGVSEQELAQFESEHGVVLPADFRRYLAVVNGLPDTGSDDNFIFFWPLERMNSLAKEYPNSTESDTDRYFIFADWSISCHEYVIRLSNDVNAATPVFVTYNPVQQIATSFSEFIERYLKDDQELLFPQPTKSN